MVDTTLLFNAEMTAAEQRAAQRQVAAGKLFRVVAGVFSSLPESEWPQLFRRERLRIIAALFPNAVISYRNAFDSVTTSDDMFLSYTYPRVIDLPGVKIHLIKGEGPQAGDTRVGQGNLYFASVERMFLDNLSIDRSGRQRNTPIGALEEKLKQILLSRGERALEELRERARAIAPALSRSREFALLDKMIGRLLGTRSDYEPVNKSLLSMVQGVDRDRLALFGLLADRLRKEDFLATPSVTTTPESRSHFAFLESYFSNFIEGTQFPIDQAADIALRGKIATSRPEDSHDILSVYELAEHPAWRALPLPHNDAVMEHLSDRHRMMMEQRPQVRPGAFKLDANAAGGTRFVEPYLVIGTLKEAARLLPSVAPGMARALLTLFIVTEIHPFDDGNGRVARLLMNAELSHAGECRMIVPTCMRDVYLVGLRHLSRDANPDTFVETMRSAQAWSASFDYADLPAVIRAMEAKGAFNERADSS